jgi:hypothetical protein
MSGLVLEVVIKAEHGASRHITSHHNTSPHRTAPHSVGPGASFNQVIAVLEVFYTNYRTQYPG